MTHIKLSKLEQIRNAELAVINAESELVINIHPGARYYDTLKHAKKVLKKLTKRRRGK